jgi:hypothetical protein
MVKHDEAPQGISSNNQEGVQGSSYSTRPYRSTATDHFPLRWQAQPACSHVPEHVLTGAT